MKSSPVEETLTRHFSKLPTAIVASLAIIACSVPITNNAAVAFIPTPSKLSPNSHAGVGSSSSSGSRSSSITNPSIRFLKRSQDDDENNDNQKSPNSKLPSWWLPSDQPESPSRQERLVRMHEQMSRFAHGSDLETLRSDIQNFKNNLKYALATDDIGRIIDLTAAIEKAQERDPEFVYSKMLLKIDEAQKMNVSKKYQLLPKLTEEALIARQFIPRLNMEGLWIGNFGNEGSGLVNVTYTGDTLIGTKVTGGCEMDKGEVLFEANLFPDPSDKSSKDLDPIDLTREVASKWGTKKLKRYNGKGQIYTPPSSSTKKEGKKELVDGQLITFNGYFSFFYLPTKQHVFFTRPGPDLILELMQSVTPIEDSTESMKIHLERCFEKEIDEELIARQIANNSMTKKRDFRKNSNNILNGNDSDNENALSLEYQRWVPRSSKDESSFSFWTFHKWMTYIDNALRPPQSKGEEGNF